MGMGFWRLRKLTIIDDKSRCHQHKLCYITEILLFISLESFDNSNENRQSRVPRALFNKLAEVFYNETNAETLLELYPCPKVHFKLSS